jgi:protein-L-isoaspartate(D-aspartate) O-methyltransferase
MATMEQRRDRLVTRQVEARGVRDPLVLAAMKVVRRELFVPESLRDEAYADTPFP